MMHSHIHARAIIFVLAVILIAGLSAPQDKAPISGKVTLFKSNVVLIPVDAVVRNRAGAYINNLRAEDFAVYDDGVEQAITLSSQEDASLDIALIVDNSISIRPYVRQLQNSAMTVLKKLNPDKDRVALFSLGAFPVQLSGLTSDMPILARAISIIPRMNATNINRTNIRDALFDASRYLRAMSQNRRRVIILVSDNEEVAEWIERRAEEVSAELLEANVALYSVKTKGESLGYGDKKLVENLAVETGGEIIRAQSESHLSASLEAVLSSVKHAYLLGFTPADDKKEGQHKITAKIKPGAHCDGCRVQARKGYRIGNQDSGTVNRQINPSKTSRELASQGTKSLRNAQFPLTYFLPSNISYDALASMVHKFWRLDMTGDGATLFERYANVFKESLNTDRNIQLMLTHYFLPEYALLRNSISSNNIKAFQKAMMFYPGGVYEEIKQGYMNYHKIPAEPQPQASLRFSLQAQKHLTDSGGNELELHGSINSAPVFFYYRKGQHACLLFLRIDDATGMEPACHCLELSFPEKQFNEVLQSSIPFAATMPISSLGADVKVMLMDPFSFTYGVQSLRIKQ